MVYFGGKLMFATFVHRYNRFVAEIVVNSSLALCHVPNTGRMRELLIPKAKILVRKSENPARKTNYDLLTVKTGNQWMAIDSKLPNRLVKKGLVDGIFPEFNEYISIKDEVTFGKSRFDLSFKDKKGLWLIENKCCTYVREGRAMFPDAPTERGRKHMMELITAAAHGYKTAVFFIVQCDYAEAFYPNDSMDPDFGLALRIAKQNGTVVFAYSCQISYEGINIYKRIPVFL